HLSLSLLGRFVPTKSVPGSLFAGKRRVIARLTNARKSATINELLVQRENLRHLSTQYLDRRQEASIAHYRQAAEIRREEDEFYAVYAEHFRRVRPSRSLAEECRRTYLRTQNWERDKLSNYEKNKNRNLFKFKAYRKAADLIKTHPTPIKSGKQAKEMNGIGDKIAKKIDEILTPGSLKKLCEVKQDDEANSINELTKISGVG
uniref:HHH_8 domain-containing protein n=1 Tax=Macrostomum lignano TaxID=282301 RepID=A0A1I8FRW7_9PLAT